MGDYVYDSICMLILPQRILSVSAANGNIASGKDGDITWVINADGELTISGSGDCSRPWLDYNRSITSAKIDVTGMTDMWGLFADCWNLTTVDFGNNFSTESVTNMGKMFYSCRSLTSLDLSDFDTSNVTDMCLMFWGCDKLTSLDISSFDTSNVTRMSWMFGLSSSCDGSSLGGLDVSHFNTSNVTEMDYMFYGCDKLTSLDVSHFDTSNVEYMRSMFANCNSLTSLDLSHFNMSNVTEGNGMFPFSDNFKTIQTPCNLKCDVNLPIKYGKWQWQMSDGTEITQLPKNLNYSITITRKSLDVENNNPEDSENNSQNNNNGNPGTSNGDNNGGDSDSADKDNNNQDNTGNGTGNDNNNNNDQTGSASGILEGTGNDADAAVYGSRKLTVNPTTFNTIWLSWDAVPGAKSYEIYYSTSPDSGFKRLANVKKTTYKFSKAKCGVTYYFQMRV